jgi:hypothetical protein
MKRGVLCHVPVVLWCLRGKLRCVTSELLDFLMSHFTWQHDIDPHDIRTVTYLGVVIRSDVLMEY